MKSQQSTAKPGVKSTDKSARQARPVRKLTPLQLQRGSEALAAADPVMADVIAEHGRCRLRPDDSAPFDLLVSNIIGQQLSTHAAATIEGRVRELCGMEVLEPQALRGIRHDRLRRAGLSRAKIRYIRALSTRVHSGKLDFSTHRVLPDDAIIKDLVQVPGIGPWTAEMYLMFGLGRPDVLSVGDLGLRKGAQAVYQLDERPDARAFSALAECWRPWRTIACWYLWRIVD